MVKVLKDYVESNDPKDFERKRQVWNEKPQWQNHMLFSQALTQQLQKEGLLSQTQGANISQAPRQMPLGIPLRNVLSPLHPYTSHSTIGHPMSSAMIQQHYYQQGPQTGFT